MKVTIYEKPLRIELEGHTLFVDGKEHPRTVRKASDMVNTLMDAKIEGSADAYYMFRNIYASEGIRFDITLIPAGILGSEFPKTHGHHHPDAGEGLSYPEIYQVLKGKAFFIFQRSHPNGRVDVIMVDAEEGDVILIPPGYGHVSINNGDKDLLLSNLVYDKFSAVYDDHSDNKGAAYYYLKDGEIVQNDKYIVEKNERITAKELGERYGFSCNDLLGEFHRSPHKFAFLEKPGILFK